LSVAGKNFNVRGTVFKRAPRIAGRAAGARTSFSARTLDSAATLAELVPHRVRDGCGTHPKLAIDASQHAPTLQLECSDAKTNQDGHEDEAVPDLQPPFDGFEDHAEKVRT
jgi:hypothetical protein